MTLHPEIQTRAQAEIDGVVKGRLPGIQDQDNLPYTTAVVLETLRWGIQATFSKIQSIIML